ncbi:MAG: sugar ABC transporter ATP-binding protein [Lachnospiraceae bacterium]|nr:sugar ABC transporter ATP-binding protein [Lachnospiraceae bacterium]
MKGSYLEVRHVSKTFPGVKALQDVSLCADKGEIIGLVGINGAGKSTLMNILCGVLTMDEGSISIDGRQISISNPRDAEQNGIAIIHQESIVFQFMTVAENLYINHLEHFVKNGRMNYKTMYGRAAEDLEKVGCKIDPSMPISDVTIGERQMIEIVRALNQGADIILFDEPTSSLTIHEKDILFDVIRNLKASGKTVIYISHFLNEILDICDTIVVMRDGKVVNHLESGKTELSEIIENMVGHKAVEIQANFKINTEKPMLSVSNLSAGNKVRDISFSLYEGEILGFWGLLGSGRTEIIRAMLGLDKRNAGTVTFYDENEKAHTIRGRELMEHCGYITESRHHDGLFLRLPVYKNFTMANLGKYCNQFLRMKEREEKQELQTFVEKLQIKLPGFSAAAEQLSGGNQQKLIIARWLSKKQRFYIFDEPTRGVDVNAKSQIHQLIFDLARAGNGVIVISSEIEECMSLSSRIAVIRKGQIVGEVTREEASDSKLMALCMGEEA